MRIELPILTNSLGSRGATASKPEVLSLIDQLLARQQELTAVERFSDAHQRHGRHVDAQPLQAKYYRDLIPLSTPKAGEQYAFEVDLDACSGCKACVAACHNLNGLDSEELWRNVGLLIGGPPAAPTMQHVTTACHHCVEPACMAGCPVLAYEKDPITGIVRHLDDQCIGCQYCTLKCPYDVPKYNKSRGIVRKCDMCSDRLAVGEAPACVAACPNEAIKIRIFEKKEILALAKAKTFLPGAPDPDYTLPTTRYKSKRPIPQDLMPADFYRVAPQHAHWPLVVMLVLTQLSVGAYFVGQLLSGSMSVRAFAAFRPLHAIVALALGMLALGASTLHLGRPLYAFRAIIGLRTSWLSREILTFGGFAQLAAAYAACCWFQPKFSSLITPVVLSALGAAVAVVGMMGVLCSVMIYHDTRRTFWHFKYTATKFFLSMMLMGVATTLATAQLAPLVSHRLSLASIMLGWGRVACGAMAAIAAIKLGLGLMTFRHLKDPRPTEMKRTAWLLIGPLKRATTARLLLGFIGGIFFPLLAINALSEPHTSPAFAAGYIITAFVLTFGSELLERYLFFTAVIAKKMPGRLGR